MYKGSENQIGSPASSKKTCLFTYLEIRDFDLATFKNFELLDTDIRNDITDQKNRMEMEMYRIMLKIFFLYIMAYII